MRVLRSLMTSDFTKMVTSGGSWTASGSTVAPPWCLRRRSLPFRIWIVGKWILPEGGENARSGEAYDERTRRNHTPAFKAKVALAAAEG